MPSARTLRYSGIISPDRLSQSHVLIIGCGAIGRQAAISCAQMGVGSITLVDMDTVSEENLGPQGWAPLDIGQTKVEALRVHLDNLNPDCQVTARLGRIEDVAALLTDPYTHLFVCVDNMDVRAWIHQHFYGDPDSAPHFFDARMGAETLHIYHLPAIDENSPPQDPDIAQDLENRIWAYMDPSILFPQSEAAREACTERSTTYCAGLAGHLLACFLGRTLREGMVPPFHTTVNMTALELFTEEAPRRANPPTGSDS